MEPYDSCLVLLMPLTSPLKISSVVTNYWQKKKNSLRQRHTHTHILGFLPASIDPFTPRKTKEAPPDRKKEAGVFGQDYSPVRELSLGFQMPLSPPLAWSSLKRGRGEKETKRTR